MQSATWAPTAEQSDAIELIRERFGKRFPKTVLAGLAGTGKTALVVQLPKYLNISYDEVIFMTVANKAAQVLRRKAAATGFAIRAQTIFSYLNKHAYEWHCVACPENLTGEDKGECHGIVGKKKPCGCKRIMGVEREVEELDTARLIVCDEASMVTSQDHDRLLETGIPVLFVGDQGQLSAIASTGNFSVMQRPDFTLRTILRQAQDSDIIRLAHATRNNEEFTVRTDEVTRHTAPYPPIAWDRFDVADSIVLCATDKVRRRMNYQARRALARPDELVEGDYLVSHHNNPDLGIYNGSIFVVERVINKTAYAYFASIRAVDENRPAFACSIKRVELDQDLRAAEKSRFRFGHFVYGYAMTVHKAQGSEWDNVLVIGNQFWGSKEEQRRWRYTAYTRARSRLVIHS